MKKVLPRIFAIAYNVLSAYWVWIWVCSAVLGLQASATNIVTTALEIVAALSVAGVSVLLSVLAFKKDSFESVAADTTSAQNIRPKRSGQTLIIVCMTWIVLNGLLFILLSHCDTEYTLAWYLTFQFCVQSILVFFFQGLTSLYIYMIFGFLVIAMIQFGRQAEEEKAPAQKIPIIALAISVGLKLSVALLSLFVMLWPVDDSSMGIIGGADMPTLRFITNTLLNSIYDAPTSLGIAIAVTGLFCLIFRKTVSAHCRWKTTGIALGCSAAVSLGVYCVAQFVTCLIFDESYNHPITFPLSIIFGVISAIILFILLFLYVWQRKKHPSRKGVLLDLLSAALYFIPFLRCGAALHNILSEMIGLLFP